MYKQSKLLFAWDLFETSIVQVYAYTSAAMSTGAQVAGLFTAKEILWFMFIGGMITGLTKSLDSKISTFLGEPAPSANSSNGTTTTKSSTETQQTTKTDEPQAQTLNKI
jgi:hypothetical protein